jgi:hypothetical protein
MLLLLLLLLLLTLDQIDRLEACHQFRQADVMHDIDEWNSPNELLIN